jgi:hypothetical protein
MLNAVCVKAAVNEHRAVQRTYNFFTREVRDCRQLDNLIKVCLNFLVRFETRCQMELKRLK